MNGRKKAALGVTQGCDCVILRGKSDMGAGAPYESR